MATYYYSPDFAITLDKTDRLIISNMFDPAIYSFPLKGEINMKAILLKKTQGNIMGGRMSLFLLGLIC
jgi:hypothetical protein